MINDHFKTGGKICNLFLKFIDKVKTSLNNGNMAKDLIFKINGLIKSVLEFRDFAIFYEYSSLFEILGLLISQKYIDVQEKSSYIKV